MEVMTYATGNNACPDKMVNRARIAESDDLETEIEKNLILDWRNTFLK